MWLVVGVVIALCLIGLLLTDPRSAIKYHPTNGMAMMAGYAAKFESEKAAWPSSMVGVQFPSEFVNYGVYSEGREIPLVIQRFTFVKGELFGLQMIARRVGLYRGRPSISTLAFGVDDKLSYHKFTSSNYGQSGFSAFRSDSDYSEVRKLKATLKSLPANSRLIYGSSFSAVQLGKEVRVYSDKDFPAELDSLRDALTVK